MWSGWVQGNSIWSVMSFQWFYMVNMHLIKEPLHYFLMWSGWVQGNSNGPLVPIEDDVIPMVLLVNMHLINLGPGWA